MRCGLRERSYADAANKRFISTDDRDRDHRNRRTDGFRQTSHNQTTAPNMVGRAKPRLHYHYVCVRCGMHEFSTGNRYVRARGEEQLFA